MTGASYIANATRSQRPWGAASPTPDSSARREWSDWVHPLLWLEVLRGLRSYGFLLGFLITQLIVIGFVLMVVLLSPFHSREEMIFLEHLIWIALKVPLLVVLPALAYISIRIDRIRRTLELVSVTGLKPYDILYGKWNACNIQAMLLASLVVPCLTLRYYTSGSNPVMDLVGLAELWAISSTLCATALAIGAATNSSDRFGICIVAGVGWSPFAAMGIGLMGDRSLILGQLFFLECLIAAACLLLVLIGPRIAMAMGTTVFRDWHGGGGRREVDSEGRIRLIRQSAPGRPPPPGLQL